LRCLEVVGDDVDLAKDMEAVEGSSEMASIE
jgi:hypothetical protein